MDKQNTNAGTFLFRIDIARINGIMDCMMPRGEENKIIATQTLTTNIYKSMLEAAENFETELIRIMTMNGVPQHIADETADTVSDCVLNTVETIKTQIEMLFKSGSKH